MQSNYLVDGKYGIEDLVDIKELERIFMQFHKATGFTIGFLDHPGLNILIQVGWRDICTRMHRACTIGNDNCIKSNRHLLDNLDTPGKLIVEECDNGLVDCAFPIIIKGKHIASLATGQLLLHKPDLERFRKQAHDFGLDEKAYMAALKEVPVVSEEKLKSITTFIGEMAIMLSKVGYSRLIEKENSQRLELEIAARQQTEHELATEREQLIVTLKSIGDGVITTDTMGKIILVNKVAEKLTGYTLEQSIGQPLTNIFRIINQHSRETCENPVKQILSAGDIVSLSDDTLIINRDNSARTISISGAPIRDENATIIGVVIVFRDITDKQNAERALQNAQRLEALGVLAGGIAHDFNNILMAIMGQADLIRASHYPLPPDLIGISDILNAAKRAAELCDQMLAFAGRGLMKAENVNMKTLTEEMLNMLKTCISKKATLQLNIDEDLPYIYGTASQLRQILMNLVVNASDAIGDQNGSITISMGTTLWDKTNIQHHCIINPSKPGKYVYIEIADTGCGMTQQTIERIFDPFFTTKFTGRGLGLSATIGIISSHKGGLCLKSKVGKGTSFKVLFPAVETEKNTVDVAAGPKTLKGYGTILLADDEPSIRIICSKQLQHLGFDVMLAEDGLQAVQIYKEFTEKISCIILDLTMPNMNGEEAFKEIKKINPDARIVLSSGYCENDITERFKDMDLSGALQKPFTMAELKNMISTILPNQT